MSPMLLPNSVRDMSLFFGLTEKDRDDLLVEGSLRHYMRGQILFRHGEAVAQFYIVVVGLVQLYRENVDGSEKTIDLFRVGQTLCESEIMDACRHHRASAKAIDEVTVLVFSAAWLKNTAKKHIAFALNLLSLISKQAHLAEVEAEHQATLSAAQMVACFLQRICVLYDFDHRSFDLPYSKTLIASRLGIELETFSRALVKLKAQGVSVEGSHVRVSDLKRITQYVCSFCSVVNACSTHQELVNMSEDTASIKKVR